MAPEISSLVTVVTVTVDTSEPSHPTFTAEPPHAEVPSTGVLVWSFRDLPARHRPAIEFVSFQADEKAPLETEFEEPTGGLRFGRSRPLSFARAVQVLQGPPGEYWYQVSLVPRRGAGEQVIRLECEPAAGIKIPPARPEG